MKTEQIEENKNQILVFDLEMAGERLSYMDPDTFQYMTRRVEAEPTDMYYQKIINKIDRDTSFSPNTSQIVALSVYQPLSEKGAVYFQAPDEDIPSWSQDNISFKVMDEAQILKKFWALALQSNIFITFGGKVIDLSFLMLRSAFLGIKPAIDLYSLKGPSSGSKSAPIHYDLYELLSNSGKVKNGGLHMWCRSFGIESPKKYDGAVSGANLKESFYDKKYKEIALYAASDVVAVYELFKYWQNYLSFGAK